MCYICKISIHSFCRWVCEKGHYASDYLVFINRNVIYWIFFRLMPAVIQRQCNIQMFLSLCKANLISSVFFFLWNGGDLFKSHDSMPPMGSKNQLGQIGEWILAWMLSWAILRSRKGLSCLGLPSQAVQAAHWWSSVTGFNAMRQLGPSLEQVVMMDSSVRTGGPVDKSR